MAANSSRGAIVLGTSVNGIGVIRSLGRLGARCGAIFRTENGDHAHYSKYLIFAHRVTAHASNEEMHEALDRVAKSMKTKRPVLIPTSDRFSQFICQHQTALSENYEFNCSDINLNDTFLDKWKTTEICRENDVLVPETYCPETSADLKAIAEKLRYPVIVKPRYTFEGKFPGKNMVCVAAADLITFFKSHNVLSISVIQEIIPSGDGAILVVASYSGKDGKIQAIYSGTKLRQYLPDYGATCFGISEKHPDLERETRRFLDSIEYRGFAMLEFARSREDGRSYFLELNTRTAWHNQLYADAGVDLTQIGYLDMIGEDYAKLLGSIKQRDDVIWLDFRRDFASIRLKRRQKQITVWQWLRSIVQARSFAYWSWHDPKPFFVACVWRARGICRKYIFSRKDEIAESAPSKNSDSKNLTGKMK